MVFILQLEYAATNSPLLSFACSKWQGLSKNHSLTIFFSSLILCNKHLLNLLNIKQ